MAPKNTIIGLFDKLIFALDMLVLADFEKDVVSAIAFFELTIYLVDEVLRFAAIYKGGAPDFLDQERIGDPGKNPWRVLEEEKDASKAFRALSEVLAKMILNQWKGARRNKFTREFPFTKTTPNEHYYIIEFAIVLMKDGSRQMKLATVKESNAEKSFNISVPFGNYGENTELPKCFEVYRKPVTNKTIVDALDKMGELIRECDFLFKLAILKFRTGRLDDSDYAAVRIQKLALDYEIFIYSNLNHKNLLYLMACLDYEMQEANVKELFKNTNMFKGINLERPKGEYVEVKYHDYYRKWVFYTYLIMEIELIYPYFAEMAANKTKQPYFRMAIFLKFHYLYMGQLGITNSFTIAVDNFIQAEDKLKRLKEVSDIEKTFLKTYNKLSLTLHKSPRSAIEIMPVKNSRADAIISESVALNRMLAFLRREEIRTRPCEGFSQPVAGEEEDPLEEQSSQFREFVTSYCPTDDNVNLDPFKHENPRAPADQVVKDALLHFLSLE